jgi:hypothetical protein
MDLSSNSIGAATTAAYHSQQQYDIQIRRLRLMSELIEDYQENMRRAMWLISSEMGVSNSSLFGHSHRIRRIPPLRTPRDTYSDEEPELSGRRGVVDPPYSFNRLTTPQMRRGFIYTTQLTEREDATTAGLTSEQIESCTRLIQYDASMNEIRCPITWDAFEPGQNVLEINNCRHIFGQAALMEWFQSHSICPVCRTNVIQPGTSTQAQAHQPSSLNQLISGILSGVNTAATNENGYYESEFEINMEDLLRYYTQLVQPSATTTNNHNQSSSPPSSTPDP